MVRGLLIQLHFPYVIFPCNFSEGDQLVLRFIWNVFSELNIVTAYMLLLLLLMTFQWTDF